MHKVPFISPSSLSDKFFYKSYGPSFEGRECIIWADLRDIAGSVPEALQ